MFQAGDVSSLFLQRDPLGFYERDQVLCGRGHGRRRIDLDPSNRRRRPRIVSVQGPFRRRRDFKFRDLDDLVSAQFLAADLKRFEKSQSLWRSRWCWRRGDHLRRRRRSGIGRGWRRWRRSLDSRCGRRSMTQIQGRKRRFRRRWGRSRDDFRRKGLQ
jgi:hypothetical protein